MSDQAPTPGAQSSVPVQIPNASVPVLTGQGVFSTPWRRFFQAMFANAGGSQGGGGVLNSILSQLVSLSSAVAQAQQAADSAAADAAQTLAEANLAEQLGVIGSSADESSLPAEEPGLGVPGLLALAQMDQAAAAAGPIKAADVPLLLIGFALGSGAPGTNVSTPALAPRAGAFSTCKFVTKAADPGVALTFDIRRNGASIFSTPPVVAANAAAGTVSTFATLTASPLAINAGDVFTVNISSGSSLWSGLIQVV